MGKTYLDVVSRRALSWLFDGMAERRQTEKPPEILPIYPNPGSQSDLIFNVLGAIKGEPAQVLRYPESSVGTIRDILSKERISLQYPDILQPSVEQFPIDVKKGINPKARTILYRAGNGAGKSTMGAILCYLMSVLYPDAVGLISANSYDQLRDSTLVALIKFLLAHNIPFSPWKGNIPSTVRSIESRKGLEINGCWHFVRSADNFSGGENSPQPGRGLEVSHVWGDEWLRSPDDTVFNTVVTRARIPGIPSIILLTSTINTSNPYNWGWQKFDDPERSPEMKAKFVSIAGSSIENRHNLSNTYVEDMWLSMTPELFRIEVIGEYVGITSGRLIKYFSRELHVFEANLIEVDNRYPIYLSFDFNWNPSTAIAAQFIENELRIVREWHLKDSNTFELADAVLAWVSQFNQQLIVTGDASGGQRTANSRQTNWQIVAHALRKQKAQYVYGKRNPSIQDTVNAVNTAFSKERIILSSECKELIKDLETATYPYEDFKRKNPERSHWLDELRYLCDYVMPYSPPRNTANQYKTGVMV